MKLTRRQFLKKLGRAAAAVPVATLLPMPKLATPDPSLKDKHFTGWRVHRAESGFYEFRNDSDTGIYVNKALTNFSLAYIDNGVQDCPILPVVSVAPDAHYTYHKL